MPLARGSDLAPLWPRARWALAAGAALAVVSSVLAPPDAPTKWRTAHFKTDPGIETRAPVIAPAALTRAIARHPLVAEGLRRGDRSRLDGRWPARVTARLAMPIDTASPSSHQRSAIALWQHVGAISIDWEPR
ncbi:MAG: hypothetical protein ACKVP7_04705 [Hyphomicrobiaceae bacterium]